MPVRVRSIHDSKGFNTVGKSETDEVSENSLIGKAET